ncbi:MAG: acyl-CoA dehydrogenase family protein [Betaproteobacteria bacterium]|nr:acyl-CoA dehydrogenase family protein [Betaproteobacteria bacterium]
MALDAETFDQLLNNVTRFVRERLLPAESRVSKEDQIPDDIIADMRKLGLFGLTAPEKYGGLGLSVEEEMRVVFEISFASAAFRSLIGTNNGVGSQGIVVAGTEEQRQKYLPKIASGDIIASFALTEPGSGSDAGSLKTKAVKQGDNWILNGTKRFITHAPKAGLFTVFARTDPRSSNKSGVSAFLVERGSPGLSLGKPYKKMGQQGAHICDVIFEDCVIPNTSLLGKEGGGFDMAMRLLDRGRLHVASACIGAAERLIHEALTYAIDRRQFGKPIAEFQLIQAMLADSRTEALAGRSMILETARLRDRGGSVRMEASCCKLFCSEMVGRIADRAVQILGGAGYIADYGIERMYRDVRLFRIYEGTSQIQQLVIARQMIKAANSKR